MNRLKELRKERGLTLINIASELKIPKSTLNRYENEESEPKQETWQQLADFFDVPIPYLMGISKQKFSDSKAITVAKEIYNEYLSDNNLDDDKQNAIKYFDNENLDTVLGQAMQQYFTISAVQTSDWTSLKNNYFLYSWLEEYLIGRYRNEVKTNHNLISSVQDMIPSTDEIDAYPNMGKQNQITLDKNQLKLILSKLPKEDKKDFQLLEMGTSTLVFYNYESSINCDLQSEINSILDDARWKLSTLKEKYSDKPNEIKQATVLITKTQDGSNKVWSQMGDNEEKDEVGLSGSTKQVFVTLAEKMLKKPY